MTQELSILEWRCLDSSPTPLKIDRRPLRWCAFSAGNDLALGPGLTSASALGLRAGPSARLSRSTRLSTPLPSAQDDGRDRAFTLIELIMAMAATAIILAAIYSVFSKAVHLRNRALERTRAMQVQMRAVDVIRQDLRNAIITGGSLADTLESSRESRSGSFPGNLKLVTTTARLLPEEEITPDLQQVEYFVMTDPTATDRTAGVLVRAVQKNLLAPVTEEIPGEPLLAGVEAMEVEFSDGTSWVDTWQLSETQTDLPKAIRVTIRRSPASSPDAVPVPIEILVPWMTERAVEPEETEG